MESEPATVPPVRRVARRPITLCARAKTRVELGVRAHVGERQKKKNIRIYCTYTFCFFFFFLYYNLLFIIRERPVIAIIK